MAKKIKAIVKLQIPGGKANPAPPVGPALGQHGVNIQEFCGEFNEKTKEQRGDVVPVVLTIFEDRSYNFVLKSPPASELLKKAAGVPKGAKNSLTEKVGSVTKEQVRTIAERKMADMNAVTIEAGMRIIEGTAKQMGIEVKE